MNRKRIWISASLVGVSILAVAGVNAFNSFFARPGEDALRLVPKDALMVATLDLSPSPQQALTFKKIEEALSRHGMDKQLDGTLLDIIASGSPTLEPLRPFGTRAGAFAMFKGEKEGEPLFAGFIGVTDGKAVESILRKQAKQLFWKGTRYFELGNGGPALMVFENHLLVGDKASLSHLEASIEAKSSILTDSKFVEARNSIDGDANLMAFMSPQFGELFPTEGKPAQKFGSDWTAMGMAIRDEGISMTSTGKVDASQIPSYRHFKDMPILKGDLMASLPGGAYGIVALSAPSKYMDFADEFMTDSPEAQKGLSEFDEGMKENLGLGLRDDLLPALKGNVVLGAYPAEGGKGGVNALLVLDDSNGATPGGMAHKFMNWLDKQIKEGGKEGERVDTEKRGDTTVFKLSGKAEESFRRGMSGEPGGKDPIDFGKLTGDKTITVAIHGNSVLAATSSELLSRALSTMDSRKGGLNEDNLWASHASLFGQAQQAVGLSFSRIAEGIRDTMKFENMAESDAKSAREAIDAFIGLKQPMTMKALMSGTGASASMFIPLDYEKVIDFAGKFMDQTKK